VYGTVITGGFVRHCGYAKPNYDVAYTAAKASSSDPDYLAYVEGTRFCRDVLPLTYPEWKALKDKQEAAAAARAAAVQELYDARMAQCITEGGIKTGRAPNYNYEPCDETRIRQMAEQAYMLQRSGGMVAARAEPATISPVPSAKADVPLEEPVLEAEMHAEEPSAGVPTWVWVAGAAALAWMVAKR
jgi:hypothetical protein